MIHASTTQAKKKLSWKELVKTKTEYESMMHTGLAWTYFESWPTVEEFDKYLNDKEKQFV